tara:strand:+ start:239 stop:493 length:255 start_codon:yes stop_codon:yes gene_type:complete
MLNRNSAIIEKYKIGKYPFEENIEIIFSENRNLIIQQIAAWPDEISNLEKLFADQLGAQQLILIEEKILKIILYGEWNLQSGGC